jgi:hypothetical protein
MRNKREEHGDVKKLAHGMGGVQKKKAVGGSKSAGGRRNQENGGEVMVRCITATRDGSSSNTGRWGNNPFTGNDWTAGPMEGIAPGPGDVGFTKFHLEDDEMLMELMIHLHADCPDLMHNKMDLIDRVSKLYDKILQQKK